MFERLFIFFELGSFSRFCVFNQRDQGDTGPVFVLGSTAAPAVVRRAPASNTLAAETQIPLRRGFGATWGRRWQ